MKSQEILPKRYRLTELQKVQLEGHLKTTSYSYTTFKDHFQGSIYSKDELLLKYHQALKEAEKEIINLEKELELYNLS